MLCSGFVSGNLDLQCLLTYFDRKSITVLIPTSFKSLCRSELEASSGCTLVRLGDAVAGSYPTLAPRNKRPSRINLEHVNLKFSRRENTSYFLPASRLIVAPTSRKLRTLSSWKLEEVVVVGAVWPDIASTTSTSCDKMLNRSRLQLVLLYFLKRFCR